MVNQDDGQALESRPPTIADLVRLCDSLNKAGANYIVVGGMAVIQLGFIRATEDIDLLVDSSDENFQRIRQGMMCLEDGAIQEVQQGDLDRYVVVRVADEIVVDLMKSACGVDYHEASTEIEYVMVGGVSIPFATAALLWRLKQTIRPKDEVDRLFLRRLLEGSEG